MKTLTFEATSLDDLRHFPANARRVAGFELTAVQRGEAPSDRKAMPGIGSGVQELRIHTSSEYRVMYVAKFKDAIYVLHAFQKKTQKTSQKDLNLTKQRYKSLTNRLREK